MRTVIAVVVRFRPALPLCERPHTIMFRHATLTLSLFFVIASGCQRERSFMQLDSDSGVPFFGLQWSVDSGVRPRSLQPAVDDAARRSLLSRPADLELTSTRTR